MPQNSFTVLPAPTGYDNTSDPMSVPATTSQALVNFLCDRMGLIRGMGQLIPVADLSSIPPTNFGGEDLVVTRAYNMAYYYGYQIVDSLGFDILVSNPAGDRLIVEIAGVLYACCYFGIPIDSSVQFYPPYPPVYSWPVMIPAGAFNGTVAPLANNYYPRLRWAQFQKELIIVRGYVNYSNIRYYVAVNSVDPAPDPGVIYELGIGTPSSLILGSAISYNVPTGTNVPKVGLIQYTYTLADEFGRQGSPAIATELDFNANPTKDALFSFVITNPPGPLYYSYVFLYATVQGGSLFYQIYTQALTNGSNIITYEDGEPDAFVETGAVGPRYGQNDAPDPADQVVVFKNRVWLNSLLSPNEVQGSNLGSPVQFNSQGYLPTLNNVADGVTLSIDNDYGDPQYQMIVFGSYLVFFKRRGIYMLYGQDASSFQVQPLQSFRGAASPDTAVRCENVLVYLSSDGVYQFDGVNCTKLSKPIEASLLQYNLTPQGQFDYANSQAAFVARRYILNIGTDIYIFDLDAAQNGQSGWTTMLFGIDVASWMELNYGYNIFTGIMKGTLPSSNQAIAGSGIPMPFIPGQISGGPLPPPSYPLPPHPNPPPVFLPVVLTSFHPQGEYTEIQPFAGSGMSTVTSLTLNGVAVSYTIISDALLNMMFTNTNTSGLLVFTNPYGPTQIPFVVGTPGFGGDFFNRANTPLVGTHGYQLQVGTNSMNIVGAQLQVGVPADGECVVIQTLTDAANGWCVAQYVFDVVGASAANVYRSNGAFASWNGYYVQFTVANATVINVSFFKVTSGSASQIGSTLGFTVAAATGVMIQCSVNFVAGSHKVYLNGTLCTTYGDSTYEAVGYLGLMYPGSSGTPLCIGLGLGA